MGSSPTDGATALVAPRLPTSTVGRPRLDRALDRIPPGGIGLVVAPAGSGKSVLLGQWMRSSVSPACHVQVTPAHDDPVVFARALTSAIASVAPDFDPRVADSVAASGSDLGTVFVSRLLVGLEELDGELVIVLDDVHRLANTAVWADLDQLIERLPDNVRLVLSARWDPPVRLQALQLLSRAVEIRASDLAFNTDEARDLIERVSGRRLTDAQTDALVDRTDGWGAGLQLAAISLQRFADVDALHRRIHREQQAGRRLPGRGGHRRPRTRRAPIPAAHLGPGVAERRRVQRGHRRDRRRGDARRAGPPLTLLGAAGAPRRTTSLPPPVR